MKRKLRNIARFISLLREGWNVRFCFTKRFKVSETVTVTTTCDTLDSAENSERMMAPAAATVTPATSGKTKGAL